VLGIFTKWNRANITFGILTLLWALYEYASIKIYNSNSPDKYLIYYVCLWLIPSLGRIIKMLFVSFYTKVFNKTFFVVVLVLSITSFILNLLLPSELIFDKSTGFYIDTNFFSEPHTFLHGNLSPLLYFTYVSVVLNYVYVMVILVKYYQKMKSKTAIALLVVFGFRSLIILFNLLLGFIIPLPYLLGLSNITVVLTVMTLTSHDVKMAEIARISFLKNKELRMFKDKMIRYIVSEITDLIDNLSNATMQLSKEEMIVLVKVNSSRILHHVVTLLDIYKSDETGLILNRTHCNLSQIMSGVRSKIGLILQEKRIIFKHNIEEDYLINVDVTLIEKVFVNVLQVVVECINENEKITLDIQKQSERMLIINISSNTTNFPPKKNLLQLNKFDVAFNDEYFGNFSLSFCKTVLAAHKGEIGFDFKNNFATVYFTLPYVEMKKEIAFDNKLSTQELNYLKSSFNASELMKLSKYHEMLSETNFFEISKLRRLIADIECDKTISKKWLSELNISITEMNKEKYEYLINMINPHK
jgi:signal transduction histidine kinase